MFANSVDGVKCFIDGSRWILSNHLIRLVQKFSQHDVAKISTIINAINTFGFQLGHLFFHVTPNKADIIKQHFVAAQTGDACAFEHIVLHFQRKIYHFVCERVGHHYAEDVTQETFLKLYRNIHHYDPNKECNAWVYTIARTTVYDWLRKERKRNDHHIIDDDNHPFEPSDEIAGEFHAVERAAALIDAREALKHLPAEQQQALILYYWNGYTYMEIAELLSRPLNTVKTILFRAKQRMRTLLEPTLA